MKLILASLALLCTISVAQAQPATTTVPGTLLTAPSASGMIYNSAGASHIWGATTTPTLGTAGTLGSMTFGNATSGLATIEPATGALGTTVVLIPALNTTDTITTNGATQTLAGKTLTSPTINGGALSGTFTGAPTLSGNLIFSGNPSFTGAPTFSTSLSVANGGTSQNTLGANDVLIGNGTSGVISSTITYSSGALTTPSAGAYWVNSSSNGLYFPNVAPTAGAGCNSIIGVKESGSNIACSNPPNIILDASLNNSNYQTGRHFMTLDTDAALQADFFTILSHNDQTQPSTVAQNMGFGGTWNNGDNPEIEIQYTGSGGGTVFLQCLVGSTCNGAWGSGTSTAVIAGYFQNYISVNSPFPGIGMYAAGVSANTPSSGFEGFNMLYSAFYTGTVTMTNLSTTTSGTVSLHGSSSNQLDGPVGLFISRVRPSGSSRTPQALDNIGLISWTAPTASFPGGGPPGPNGTGGQPYSSITSTIIDPTSYTGDMEFYTACGGSVGTMCLRGVFGGSNAAGLVVGAPPSITSNLSHEFEVWATSSHGSEVLSVTGNVDESSSMTILAESQGGANANLEVRGSTVFAYGATGNGTCQWGGTGSSWSCSSDARIKKAFQPIGDAVRKLGQLHPVSFELRRDTSGARHDGFTAQDVQRVFPELVTRTEHKDALTPDGELSLEYTGLIPWLVKAVDELSARHRAQQDEIASLRQALNALTTRVKKVR